MKPSTLTLFVQTCSSRRTQLPASPRSAHAAAAKGKIHPLCSEPLCSEPLCSEPHRTTELPQGAGDPRPACSDATDPAFADSIAVPESERHHLLIIVQRTKIQTITLKLDLKTSAFFIFLHVHYTPTESPTLLDPMAVFSVNHFQYQWDTENGIPVFWSMLKEALLAMLLQNILNLCKSLFK